jgi:hypothetical protein
MICMGLDLTGFKNLLGLLFQQQSRINHSRTIIPIGFIISSSKSPKIEPYFKIY